MAQILKTAIQNRLIRWSPLAGRLPETFTENGRQRRIDDVTLEQELAMLVTKPTIWGYRFDHESGRHDDRAVTLGMGLLHAFPEGVPLTGLGPVVMPDPRKERSVFSHQPTERIDSPQDNNLGVPNPVDRWKIFGMGGSKWDNGDID